MNCPPWHSMHRDSDSILRVNELELLARAAVERNMPASKRVERVLTWAKVTVVKSIRVEAASFPPSEIRKLRASSCCHGYWDVG